MLEHLAPWLDEGLGLFGFAYSLSSSVEISAGTFAAVGCSKETVRVLPRAATLHHPEFIRTGYGNADVGVASMIPGWRQSDGGGYAFRAGVRDVWGING